MLPQSNSRHANKPNPINIIHIPTEENQTYNIQKEKRNKKKDQTLSWEYYHKLQIIRRKISPENQHCDVSVRERERGAFFSSLAYQTLCQRARQWEKGDAHVLILRPLVSLLTYHCHCNSYIHSSLYKVLGSSSVLVRTRPDSPNLDDISLYLNNRRTQ